MNAASLKTTYLSRPLPWIGLTLTELSFCVSLIAIFFPFKIYPFFFLGTSFLCVLDLLSSKLSDRQPIFSEKSSLIPLWAVFLFVFTLYACISFVGTYNGSPFIASNLLKLGINVCFLYTAVIWLNRRNNALLMHWVDKTLLIILILCLLQLLVYHQAFHFKLLLGVASSNEASTLYNARLFFWGLDDKNMFGARLALLGFLFILLPVSYAQKLASWRIIFVFALGYLSLSRTPVVALILGVFFLIWIIAKTPIRIGLLVFLGATLPYIAKKLIRVEHIAASNDGMGVRLAYWKTFFRHFEEISPLGNGFLRGGEFLKENAPFYHGEPHIHNTFLSCYLELGLIGFFSYTLFLIYYYRFCLTKLPLPLFWLAAFLPLIAIMMILYSGYDNDIVLYLSLIFLMGSIANVDLKHTKITIA